MKGKRGFSQKEINKKILNLRFRLNECYTNEGNTNDVIRISEELDRYIVLMQQKLADDKNLVF